MNAFDQWLSRLNPVLLRTGHYFFLLFYIVACSSEKQPEKHVFITETGTKYHLEHCRYLKFSKKVITFEVATEKGFSACKVCKPTSDNTHHHTNTKRESAAPVPIPKKPLQYAIRCSKKNINGIQCKRMTKNPSGTCWQHKD